MIHRALRRTPSEAAGLGRVQPVLDDVEEEPAHVQYAEIVDALVDSVKFVGLVGLLDGTLKIGSPFYGPAVERDHVVDRDHVLLRIEPVEVTEQEAGGVAHAPVGIRHPR